MSFTFDFSLLFLNSEEKFNKYYVVITRAEEKMIIIDNAKKCYKDLWEIFASNNVTDPRWRKTIAFVRYQKLSILETAPQAH